MPRPKGVPNKVTTRAREEFLRLFGRLTPDLESWIRKTADGVEVEKTQKDGSVVKFRMGADPGKAADLTLRMAEYHVPKLAKLEHTGEDGGPLIVEIVKASRDPT